MAQDQPPTPRTAPAQQLSSRSTERPGPSARAHRTKHQPRTASSSKDQHRVTERRRGESDTSRPERMAVNDRWTHIAKEYGMQRTPWVSEPVLDRALRYTMGQNPQGDSRAAELGRFLDDLEVDDNVRKDKQFRANVSLPSVQLPIPNATYTDVSSFFLAFESSRARLSTASARLQWRSSASTRLRNTTFVTRHSTNLQMLDSSTCLRTTNSSEPAITTSAVIRL